MALEQVTDHAQEAIDRMPSQWRDKPQIEAFLRILCAPIQRLEDLAWEVLLERTLAVAVGVQLDVLGRVIGLERGTLLDEDYRRVLGAQIVANGSSGTVETLLTVARAVVDDDDATYVMEPNYPAALVMRIEDVTTAEVVVELAIRILRKAKAAGVKFILESQGYEDADMLVLPIVTFFDNNTSSGATTIPAVDTAAFPSSGSLILDAGTADEETVTYSGKTASSFTGVSATANSHPKDAQITLDDGGLGLGDEDDPDVGGRLASAKE